MTIETWLPTVGNYEVSNQGCVRHAKTKHVRVLRIDPEGYPALNVWVDGRPQRKKVHLLVLEAFVGPRPFPEAQARHLNGIRHDNRLKNLAWGTRKENFADRHVHGTWPGGERNPIAKLTQEQVEKIRASGESSAELGRRYGVTRSLISRIRLGKAWVA